MTEESKPDKIPMPFLYGAILLFVLFGGNAYFENNYQWSFLFLGVIPAFVLLLVLKIEHEYVYYGAILLSTFASLGIYDVILTHKLNGTPKVHECGVIGYINLTNARGKISTVRFIGQHHSVTLNYDELAQFVKVQTDVAICVEYHEIKGWLRAGRVYQAYLAD